jgi:hypothetical protein
LTSISITGTSISTPTTVARAAPDDNPKSMVAVAMATSKWFDAPIMAAGAASNISQFQKPRQAIPQPENQHGLDKERDGDPQDRQRVGR